MLSNLPIIFCKGQPVDLQNMEVGQLEKFLTYVVHCSQNLKLTKIVQQPVWWSKNIPFSNPVVQPNEFSIIFWRNTLISLITECYKFYDEESLIEISALLSKIVDDLEFYSLPDNTIEIKNKRNSQHLAKVRQDILTYDSFDDIKKWTTNKNSFKLPRFPNSVVSQEEFLRLLNLKKINSTPSNTNETNYKLRNSKFKNIKSKNYPSLKNISVSTYSLNLKHINQIKVCLKKQIRLDEIIMIVHLGKFQLLQRFSEMDTVDLIETDDDDVIIID